MRCKSIERKSLLFASGICLFAGTTWAAAASPGETGAVFAATNNAYGNEVIMYSRGGDGQLNLLGRFPTGGRGEGGTNDPLQSENSMIVSADHQLLFVVNAGTSDISVFRITSARLNLESVTPSGGGNPVGLAMYGDFLYVVNFGGSYHTAGFRVNASGQLTPIQNSKQSLSTLDTGASSAAFTPDGTKLVVTERIANKIDVFTVNSDGSLSNPVYNASQGIEPFGIQFTAGGVLLVTETNGGPPNNGSLSAYTVNSDNTLSVVSSKAATSGAATCWVATSGPLAWVSNTASGSVGALAVSSSGVLTPIGAVAQETQTSFPLDLALSSDNQYLYVFYSNLGEIVGYKVASDGSLAQVTSVQAEKAGGVGAEGLAVY